MPERNELLVRTTNSYHFLNIEEFDKIPQYILDEAGNEGKKKHLIIKLNWNTSLDHPILNMFRKGLEKVVAIVKPKGAPHVEVQINGKTFTGCPDFAYYGYAVIDYKFTRDRLRPETALQLVDYDELIYEKTGKRSNDLFAFHYHQDGGLFVYKVPDRAKEPLRKFALSLVEHHEAIKAGELIKYDKINEWKRLQLEYDVFEIFYTTMPPMTVTNDLEAKTAVLMFRDLQKVDAYAEHLKRELIRYMESIGEKKLYDLTGGGVRLQTTKRVTHDKEKLQAYKKKIETGTKESKGLVRFPPPVKKQKLIK